MSAVGKLNTDALKTLLTGLRRSSPMMALFCGLVVAAWASLLRQRWQRSRASKIPAIIGNKGLLSSYLDAWRYLRNTADVIHQGYAQYPDGVFRVPTLSRWDYVAVGPSRVREVASAPESVLSFADSARDSLEADYTMGPDILQNPYHAKVTRNGLTRSLGRTFPDLLDEITVSLEDVFALQGHGNEWTKFHVLPNMRQVIARITNRIFVGLPLCRNQEFLDLNINYVLDIFTRGQIIGLLPSLLKPVLAPLISSRKSSLRRQMKFVAPMIEERLRMDQEYGKDWDGRPEDIISWLLDEASDEESTVPRLANRILAANLAAIHMTTSAITAILFDLTSHPEYIAPLREEAERVIAEEGWTKSALGNMHKMDSFIRESQRLGAASLGIVRRVASKDGFMFSDGTKIPYGTFVGVPSAAIHYDEVIYDKPQEFDGFRFSRERDEHAAAAEVSSSQSPKKGVFNHQMVVTSVDYLAWGHGKHGCPGRFLAAAELKGILAHILINYDVKAEVEGPKPPDVWFGIMRMPNLAGKIMVRKRQ